MKRKNSLKKYLILYKSIIPNDIIKIIIGFLDNRMKCNMCNKKLYKNIYKCDNCEIIYCYNCKKPIYTLHPCENEPNPNCILCKSGFCYNVEKIYCSDCV